MVELAALSLDQARAELDRLVPPDGAVLDGTDLEQLCEVLFGATAEAEAVPYPLMTAAITLARAADASEVDWLPARARVLVRLLRAGAAEPAWLVAVDSATGRVPRAFSAATSSGAERTEWPLLLLTTVEPPYVYAELPGFRDPRYDVPDAIYEIGEGIRLRCHVDDVQPGSAPLLTGWAALDVLDTGPGEQVAVVAVSGDDEVRWTGSRHRRPDLVGGSRDKLRRRAYAGWSVALTPSSLATAGPWALWLELVHDGIVRRARLGGSVGALARRSVGTQICKRPAIELVDALGDWFLQVWR